MKSSSVLFVSFLTVIACAGLVAAAPFTLTNGPGDGTVSIGVDGYGAFGLANGANTTDAFFDPVGAGGPTATTFQSMIAIGFGGPRTYISDASLGGNPTVTGSATSGSSFFFFDDMSVELTQTLDPLLSSGAQVGSLLTQQYVFTNQGADELSFDVVRYLDGDLRFDGSLVDGGGMLGSGANAILFETDSATGAADPTTFVGITAMGGVIPLTNRFEIDGFAGLRGRIMGGVALDDQITGDGNVDGFIDAGSGYDVTLAFRNTFFLVQEQSVTYITQTIFGEGSPTDVGRVPEPSTLLLLGGALALVLRRKRN